MENIQLLANKEDQISRLIKSISNFNDSLEEVEIIELSSLVASYSKQLNRSLKDYAIISYQNEPRRKIATKAKINFAYHILSLLTKIIRLFEQTQAISGEIEINFQTLIEIIDQKEALLISSYEEAALKELESFYNPEIRDKLQSELEKRISKKYPSS
ncbi:hypothetical protein NEF87_002353 [Candidatus Lokiarchaeum ossiferum]|uniref:Uncharacterized protein n=1 Tax=Candidatus Lokiarchaeum ossiferum TaxID=2951803 RepID=A0ABY6HRU4_9ARCH|nr:hypothetical protein NEF87_002353 [Candidatus Lokiarchaeum sp. B-35]